MEESPQTKNTYKNNDQNIEKMPIQGKNIISKINIDSPRTIESCKELGIHLNEFKKIKDFDDFYDSNIDRDLQQIRYEHYCKRLLCIFLSFAKILFIQETAKEILKQRSEIQRRLILKQSQSTNLSSPFITNIFNAEGSTNTFALTTYPSQKLQQSQTFFSKTIDYIKQSHKGSQIRRISEAFGQSIQKNTEQQQQITQSQYEQQGAFPSHVKRDDDTEGKMKVALMHFNQNKLRKMNEAKQMYLSEQVTLKKEEELKQRIIRLKEYQDKQKKTKEKETKLKQTILLNKLDKVKDQERKYMEMKQQKKEEVRIRLEEKKKFIEGITKQKELENSAKIERNIQKQLNFRKKQSSLQQEQMISEELLMEKINKDQFIKFQNLENSKYLIRLRLQEQAEQEEENIERAQQNKVFQQEKKEYEIIMKAIQHSEYADQKEKQRLKEEKKHRQMVFEKQKKFKEQITNLKKDEIQTNLLEKLERAQQYRDEMLMLKETLSNQRQEIRRLKELDKLENYERNKRAKQYKLQKMINHDKEIQEKLGVIKDEKNLIIKANFEIHKEERNEDERIFSNIKKINDLQYFQKLALITQKNQLSKKEKQKGLEMLKSIIDLNQEPDLDLVIFVEKPKQEEQEKEIKF